MPLPAIIGNKHLHGAAYKFVPRVSENRFGLLVDQKNLALLVDYDHGVGRRFE